MLKINILGDSITEGLFASKPEYGYVPLLANLLNAEVRNYGVSGTRMTRRPVAYTDNPADDLYFVKRVKDMNHDADFMIVFGGTNDYGRTNAPLGKMGDETEDTFYGAATLLFEELLKHYKKEQIIVISPLYREDEDQEFDAGKPYYRGSLPVIREVMKELCNKYGFDYFDIKDIVGKAEKNPLLTDGLHPNDKGHKLLANLIASYIKLKLE